MSALARPVRALMLRRSLRYPPRAVSTQILPTRFLPLRQITIQAPSPNSMSHSNEPTQYEIIPNDVSASPTSSSSSSSSSAPGDGGSSSPASSSQHPFASVSPDPPPSSGSGSTSLTSATSLPSPPPNLPATTRMVQHPFDTYAFVKHLEQSGVSSSSAIALMEGTKEMLVKRKEKAVQSMLGKEDMENEAYLFRAALSELRTELSVRARNDGLALKAMTGAIRREVDNLEQKLKEDVQTLKHDIEMDMGNRKSETRTEMKGFDIAIEEINNKFTISLGDLRTEIESAKWDATRRAIATIVLLVALGVAATLFTAEGPKSAAVEAPKASSALMRDMAVGTDDDLMEEVLPVKETEERLERLLSGKGVGVVRATKEKKPKDRENDRI